MIPAFTPTPKYMIWWSISGGRSVVKRQTPWPV
jgi:hypothetical protein